MSDTYRRLTDVLSGWSKVASPEITPEMEIDAGLDIDSLTRLELCLALKKEFQQPIDDDQVFAATTVSDLLNLLSTPE
ncbi:acyl carrier protein [Saccharopolyspora spinosa]|uniref:Acyl carrier protein n=1 Tax=Saccharopolyspora spinosa TaxID=60894 RepID=A0A2N3Y4Z0_SACSN|nr:acyl carrier protein [Saccharopolyspora spinosa]PKW17970.1 acyl carrier protein [Saccharopolyspora spinosa]